MDSNSKKQRGKVNLDVPTTNYYAPLMQISICDGMDSENNDNSIANTNNPIKNFQQIDNNINSNPNLNLSNSNTNINNITNTKESNMNSGNNKNLITLDEIINLTNEILSKLSLCTNKQQQFCVITELATKYLYNNHLKIVTWNARSFYKKRIETFNFLKTYEVDIALISETWLTSKDKINNDYYHIYRVDRGSARGGGVAIIISKRLIYSQISRNYLIGGDLKARNRFWGCNRANGWGNILNDLNTRDDNFCILFPPDPTYIPSNDTCMPSVIDLFLTNNSNLFTQPVTLNNLSSDHLPVCIELDSTYQISVPTKAIKTFNKPFPTSIQTLINTRNVIRRKWIKFRTQKYRLE
ncbi:homeobox protein 3-like [Condylostylus longicornis]|uniref:homeobox protein 3-like n=1 Tax=Condylostylus longicornis TaxID=2530218 RepID=UPI00244DCC16|nr:homeobox protein 3-like [Condylostylus longicornis]